MIAATTAVVEAGGVLGQLRCQPPLTLRRVHSDSPEVCALCLVGTAAGPLDGDDLRLSLELAAGARADLRATGASIAQGRDGAGAPSRLSIRASLGEGSSLRADPGALIVCQGSRVDVAVVLELAATASVEWRELIVLGRSGDAVPGAARLRWDVTRVGRPVLRQSVDLTDRGMVNWPGMIAGRRVLASAVISSPDVAGRTIVGAVGSGGVPVLAGGVMSAAQKIDDQTVLVTALASDAVSATVELDRLCALVHAR